MCPSLTEGVASQTPCSWQALLHIPASPSEMKEVLYERLAVPLQFLNISYLVTLKVGGGGQRCIRPR